MCLPRVRSNTWTAQDMGVIIEQSKKLCCLQQDVILLSPMTLRAEGPIELRAPSSVANC